MTKKEFLAFSLPYELKVLRGDNITILKVSGIDIDCNSVLFTERNTTTYGNISHSKPILRPLSDLTKEIEHNGEKFIPSVTLRLSSPAEMIGLNPATWSFRVVLKLIEWRFDIANLINKGEAIDYHTLEGFSF